MRASRPLARHTRPAGALLVLLALLLRFAIPTGFMLSAEGGLAVVPCPTVLPALAEAHTSHHDAHAGHHQHDESPEREPIHDDRPCPYGVLSVPGLAPAEIGLLVRVPAFGEPLAIPEPAAPDVRPIASPPPPSRGPPSLS